MDELEKAQLLLEETRKLAQANHKLVRVCQKLSRKIKADIQFLEKYNSKKCTFSENARCSVSSSNIPYLSGVLNVVKRSEDVQDVICDLKRYGIVVDVVCNGGKTWKKVVARNPQSLHLIWAGRGQYGTKDVVKKAEKYLECVKLHSEFSPPEVVCVFCNGVTHEMAQALETKGIVVEGERLDVSQEVTERLTAVFSDDSEDGEDSGEEECWEVKPSAKDYIHQTVVSDSKNVDPMPGTTDSIQKICDMAVDDKLFLDITTMLVYASDMANGGCGYEFREPILAQQAAAEKQESALGTIQAVIKDKTLVTCQSALDDYWGIVNIMGGPEEKSRAKQLTQMLTVVPDHPSKRFCALSESGQIRARSKMIFGTADTFRCPILTSNERFVRAASAQNVHIVSAILHQPRALSERKRLTELSNK